MRKIGQYTAMGKGPCHFVGPGGNIIIFGLVQEIQCVRAYLEISPDRSSGPLLRFILWFSYDGQWRFYASYAFGLHDMKTGRKTLLFNHGPTSSLNDSLRFLNTDGTRRSTVVLGSGETTYPRTRHRFGHKTGGFRRTKKRPVHAWAKVIVIISRQNRGSIEDWKSRRWNTYGSID